MDVGGELGNILMSSAYVMRLEAVVKILGKLLVKTKKGIGVKTHLWSTPLHVYQINVRWLLFSEHDALTIFQTNAQLYNLVSNNLRRALSKVFEKSINNWYDYYTSI